MVHGDVQKEKHKNSKAKVETEIVSAGQLDRLPEMDAKNRSRNSRYKRAADKYTQN